MILLDTSGLVAFFVRDEPEHARVVDSIARERPPYLVSPFVLAELDYLIASRGGIDLELAVLRELASGAYDLVELREEDVAAAADVVERYRELGIGLTDASIVVLAARHGLDRVLTLDERHFRALRTVDGEPFTVLPADAPSA